MKLKAEELRSPLTVTISGDEPWLGLIYQSFDMKGPAPSERRITGSLKVTPTNYGLYDIEGDVQFTPSVSCSRCEDQIAWPIQRKIKVRYLEQTPLDEEEIKEEIERDLEPSDMDAYYIDPQGMIDLEVVVNDFIQTALPTRLVKTSADGKSCLICHKDVSEKTVFKDAVKPEHSPFAVLKNLKLPEE
ncbi:MAG TPA: DUF177 domain-containing protein [Oligoflexus sp.]|uniref:YceD family protein n=1 Tax=Oligoflexus sp. TaxID=1971216 RepID=UPI002D30D77D|nr:DUF177 domain-containing protein [Oligoflexus sp.]HYX32083.1 DUF177 domain-containing protein [Oligoflexus sp.]